MRKLIVAIVLLFGGVAVAPGVAEAKASGCTYWVSDFEPSGHYHTSNMSCSIVNEVAGEWYRTYNKCQYTGTTKFWSPKGDADNEIVSTTCGLGRGYAVETGYQFGNY